MKWGARVLRVRSVSREEVWASAGVQGAWVVGCGCEADKGMFVFVESEALFVVVLPRRGCAMHRMTRAPHFTPQHWLLCHMGLY